ncbi:MAG: hypothetical protein IKQ91_03630 [Oscillospiraceae bacterium]|nr:hypothetical protein [Oscillospiraceae bacterium]
MLQLDLQKHPLTLTLGSLTLMVSDYHIKTETAVIRRVLCDGTVTQTVCGDYPCKLTVTGQSVPEESGSLLAALTAEMCAHTVFAFQFAGITFTDMKIIAAEGRYRNSDGVTEYSLTLTGGLTNDAAVHSELP